MNDPIQSRAADDSKLLSSEIGLRDYEGWRGYRKGRRSDFIFDLAARVDPRYWQIARAARRMPVRQVHIASVEVPARRAGLDSVIAALCKTRHEVSVSLAPLGDRGKFGNINVALRDVDLGKLDWLIVVDDDVAFPDNFLDQFLYICEAAELKLAQPAHRFRSYATWRVTQRVWNSLAHLTAFVECGPLTAFHRDIFSDVIPFEETRWAWGIDILWAELARRRGFRIGIVDATPIEHLRPVAQSYDVDTARTEAQQLFDRFGINRTQEEVFIPATVLSKL